MAAVSAAAENLGDVIPLTTQEHLYKVLVIGEFGVGKTSIIRRYTEGYFSPNYKLTIGVDFALKTVDWDEAVKVNLQLWKPDDKCQQEAAIWQMYQKQEAVCIKKSSEVRSGTAHVAGDIAGHERFGHMTRVYYKYAIAAIVVFDVSRPATFDAVLKWLDDVNSKVMLSNEQPVPVLLLANKCDIDDVSIEKEKIDNFVRQHNFIGWFPTSAKSDVNIEDAMKFLIEHIMSLPIEAQNMAADRQSLVNSMTSSLDTSYRMDDTGKRRTTCCKV